MKKNIKKDIYGVLGLGRFGFSLAQKLAESGAEVIVVDMDENKVREARAFTEYAYIVGKLTRESLDEIGIKNCSTVIVCIGDSLDVSLLTTLNVINLGVKRVISKAMSPEHGLLLEKIGAEVVYPERDMGERLAKKLTVNSVLDYINLSNDIEILECSVPKNLIGISVAESNIRQKYSLSIIAIQNGSETMTNIDPNYRFLEGNIMVLIGKSDNLRRFQASL
jgi:trk system potassium uptake protein TrkA